MSNRLTFSLASLVLILGLVFATVPAMADEDTTNPSHTHPTVTITSATTGDVPGSISPITFGDNPSTDPTETNWAQLKLKFKLNTVATVDNQIDAGIELLDTSGLSIPLTGDTGIAVTTVSDYDNDNDSTTTVVASSEFNVTVTLTSGGDAPTTVGFVKVAVAATQFMGARTIDPKTGKLDTSDGKTSEAHTVSLKVTAPETTAPTLEIDHTPADGVKVAADNTVTFTFTFSEALGSNGFAADDVTVSSNGTEGTLTGPTDGTGTDAGKKIYTLPVVLTDPYADVTVTVPAAAVNDLASNDLAADVSEQYTAPEELDTTPPTVTITAPTEQEADGDLVFDFAFNELLGNASNDLQAGDIDVTGGTVTSVVQDTTDAKKYAVTVTPTDTPPQVAIELRADSVADAAGNFIDLTGANDGKSTYDEVHPTVVSHTHAVAAAPTGATGDFLDFTFTFSEPMLKSSITVSAVDQGSSHNAHFNRSYFFDAADTAGDATNSYTITVKVLDPQKVTTIALKIGLGSVEDMAKNGLAESYTASATHTPPANTAPIFVTDTIPPDDNQALNWCEDQKRAAVLLPKARDTEGDSLTYSLSASEGGNVIPANPSPVPTSGLYWITIDSETRHLLGKAELADKGTYTWTVTDEHGLTNTDPKTITINVKKHQPPKPVKVLLASKVNSASEQPPTMNRVILGFDVPGDFTGWPDCIPPVTSYTVHIDAYNEVLGKFEDYGTDTEYQLTDKSRFTVDAMGQIYSLALDELPKGIYQFQITPHNISTLTHPTSDPAVWNKTLGKRVVVADVPAAPIDLRAAVADGVYATVNWVKVPDYRASTLPYQPGEDDGGAPIYDDDKQDKKRNMYYGPGVNGDFGGYVLYQVNQTTNVETRYLLNVVSNSKHLHDPTANDKKAASITNYDHPTTRVGPLGVGEYVFRVTAVNVAGESSRSESTPWAHIKIVTATTPAPPVGGLPTNKVVDAEYNASTGIVSLASAGSLAANDFAVINSSDLPDLQLFYLQGGTLSVLNTSGANKDIVISEIMWAWNERQPAGQKAEQFIELYNSTATAIPLSTVTIVFNSSTTVPATPTGKVLLDQVSNVAQNPWLISAAPGQNGTLRLDGDPTTVVAKNLISMHRTINYDNVVKIHDAKDAAKNRTEQLKAIPIGNEIGSWAASNAADNYAVNRIGSPGMKHFVAYKLPTKSAVAGAPFRINEIGNDTGSDNDWIELHNSADSASSLKNYAMSVVTAKGTDTKLFDFKDQDWKVPGKGYVVISTRHPSDTDLAAGKDISLGDNDQVFAGASHSFVVKSVNLPDDGKFALILRNAHDKQGSGNNLIDVVATQAGAFAYPEKSSSLWPLEVTAKPNGNVIDGTDDEVFKSGIVYKRNGGDGRGEKQFAVAGYTGVGYDRTAAATAVNGGTPGYDNGALKEKIADSDADVTISEIMLDPGAGRQNLPQWIELYNGSLARAINLNGWKLTIENTTDVETALSATITLGGNINIQPNQTVLIVTNSGKTSDADHFPSNRVINLWTTKAHRDALGISKRTEQVFSATGFYLELTDKDNKLVDEVGNLDGSRRTQDDPAWAVPKSEDSERRSSLIRVYDGGVAEDGMTAAGWMLAETTDLAYAITDTYYGDKDDYGTPGYRGGGPLPVSLSKFRPERLKDTGEIVIRWITESELNNAGFNILRSETRNGEFTKINTSLIAGKGTTSERTAYEWKDTSAKPNVVYYYQIQDVSLDGQVQTLRQSRLKGNVTAAGKLTTTWGELKALQ